MAYGHTTTAMHNMSIPPSPPPVPTHTHTNYQLFRTPPPPRSIAAARWQDGWAVKLSNPPPETFGLFQGAGEGAVEGRRPVTVAGSDSAQAKHSASDAALGAVTAGLVGTVFAMVVIVLAALCFVLRRASHGGGGALRCPAFFFLTNLFFCCLYLN